MDPEANYAEQKMLYKSTDPANVERRAELVQAMREWVRNGGFKPDGYKGPAWEPCKEDEIEKILQRDRSSEGLPADPRNRPGKFESSGEIGKQLYEIVGDGGVDDEAGDVNGPGDHWYGLLLETGIPGAEHAVVSESNQGFFEYTAFEKPEDARAEFDRISAEVSEEEEPELSHRDAEGRLVGLDEMLDEYISTALLYSPADETGRSLSGRARSDIDGATMDQMRRDVESFLADYRDQIRGEYARAGADFWLTRNRHGAGFWDGDWPKDDAKILTDGAHAYGESELYVDDDGKIRTTELARIEDQNDRRDRIRMAAESANRKRT